MGTNKKGEEMNIGEFCSSLNRRESGQEITKAEEAIAKENGWVVVFGYSDDVVEFRGAINDELGAGDVFITKDGTILEACHECDCAYCGYSEKKKHSVKLKCLWNESGDDGPAWEYSISIPHATFDVMEDGQVWCRGLVFAVKHIAEYCAPQKLTQ